MITLKLRTLGYGAIASVVLAASGCYMDGNTPHNVDYSTQQTMKTDAKVAHHSATTKVAKSASSEPVQTATPGPKRAAAPQLPVIQ